MLNETAPAAKPSRFSEEGGHFYGYHGETDVFYPLHKEGGTFTLREARKLQAAGQIVLPSVTGVFKILHKQQLVDWKIEQALKVAIKAPYQSPHINPGSDAVKIMHCISAEADWIDHTMSTASGASRGAADLGTRIHAAIEDAIAGKAYDASLDVYVQSVLAERARLGLQSIASEICVGSLTIGVAGRCDDLCSGLTVVDYKSRKTKPGRKAPSYETDVMQLAFYGCAFWGPTYLEKGRGLIFVISTTVPGQCTPVEYGPADLKKAFEAFEGMAAVWRFLNKFDPRWLPAVIANK